MERLPWSRIVRLAIVGTMLMTLGVFLDLGADSGNTVGLVQPGQDGPSIEVFREDFPDVAIPDGLGHDGQQFYAIARSPMHFDEVSPHLDRAQYRFQRPLYPVLAWALHPSGGGRGLISAMVVVGVVSIFLAGLGAGSLSVQLGGGTWPALLVPLLPGTFAAMRISLADTLAIALTLLALTAVERGRAGVGACAAVLSVFAKEALLIVLLGHALSRRTRASIIAAGAAAMSTAAWWVALKFLVDAAATEQVVEFTWPFGGVVSSLSHWLAGDDWIAGVTVVGAFVLAAAALWTRGRSHPLFGALAASTIFSIFLGRSVLGLDFNGPRTIGPMLILAILTFGTPTPSHEGVREQPVPA